MRPFFETQPDANELLPNELVSFHQAVFTKPPKFTYEHAVDQLQHLHAKGVVAAEAVLHLRLQLVLTYERPVEAVEAALQAYADSGPPLYPWIMSLYFRPYDDDHEP